MPAGSDEDWSTVPAPLGPTPARRRVRPRPTRVTPRQARARRRQAFYRHHAPPLRLHREHEAGADRLALEEHGARTTDAVLAAHMRARQVQVIAQEIGKGGARLRGARARLSVDDEANGLLHARPPAPLERGDQRALRQHPRDPPAIVGRRVQVSVGRQRRGGRLRRLPQPRRRRLEADQQRLRRRRRAPASTRHRRSRCARPAMRPSPVPPQERRATGEGEVPVASRNLREAPARARGRQREARLGEDLVRGERRRERSQVELGRRDEPLAPGAPGDDGAVETEQQRGQLRGGIAVGEIARRRAAIANGHVTDQAQRLGDEGRPIGRPALERCAGARALRRRGRRPPRAGSRDPPRR